METGTTRVSRARRCVLQVEAMEARTLLSSGIVSIRGVDSSYVTSLYRDALGRSPTPQEISRLVDAGASPAQSAARVFRSDEYRVGLVGRLSQRYLDQDADGRTLRAGLNALRVGATERDLIAGFVASSTYRTKAGGTNAGVVTALYRDLLGRRPDAPGLSSFTTKLDRGTPARAVARQFLRSKEFLDREVSQTVGGLLERPPSADELARGAKLLRSGRDLSTFRARVAGSAEYATQVTAAPSPATLLGDTNVPNLSRLGYFNGTAFVPVGAGSVGSTLTGQNGTHLYVIVHGWAPGYRAIVAANSTPGDPIDWWQLKGSVVGSMDPYSPWLYQGASADDTVISPNGLAQAITAYDPKAVVLAFSWVDDSATDGGFTKLLDAYESEAKTQVNGLRLAGAIEDALAPNFAASGGQVHLLGHSHGTKVATVAAAELTRVGQGVQHLTTFDSPDDDLTDEGNASNLLWYYLPGVNPTRTPGSGGTFVDNYISEFGEAFAGFPGLSAMVDVTLAPSVLYDLDDPGDKHSYGNYWYAGASTTGNQTPPVALGWSPLINPSTAPGLASEWSQTWTASTQPQYALGVSQQIATLTQAPRYKTLSYEESSTLGNVTFTGSTITLSETGTSAVYDGTIYPEFNVDGLTFDVQFTSPGDGDQLIVTIAGDLAFVMDGLSAGTTTRSVAISQGGLIYDGFFGHSLSITLASNGSSTGSTVVLSNFREFKIEDV